MQLSTFWPDVPNTSGSGGSGAIGALSSNTPNAAHVTNPLNTAAKDMVKVYAGALMSMVFNLLSGEMPAYALDESNGCISDVLWYLKKRFKDEFQV